MTRVLPHSLRGPLRRCREVLSERFGARLREIRLFGSFARGEADEDSDVDVLVVVDDLDDLEVGLVATEIARIALDTDISLATLPLSTARLAQLRRGGRLLARELDETGIPA